MKFVTCSTQLGQRMRRQCRWDVGVYLLSNSTDDYILACILTFHAVRLNENKRSVNFYLGNETKISTILIFT